jgi:hypothetical protein
VALIDVNYQVWVDRISGGPVAGARDGLAFLDEFRADLIERFAPALADLCSATQSGRTGRSRRRFPPGAADREID